MNPNVAKALLVSKVLVADGIMTDDEHAFLTDIMTKLGLTDAEKQSVTDLEGWDQAELQIKAWSEEEKRGVVELLVDAAAADGRLSASELAEIQSVKLALGLDA